jgi:hypothetical protein
MPPPKIQPIELPMNKHHECHKQGTSINALISRKPTTAFEKDLQAALIEKDEEAGLLQSHILQMQAAMVL